MMCTSNMTAVRGLKLADSSSPERGLMRERGRGVGSGVGVDVVGLELGFGREGTPIGETRSGIASPTAFLSARFALLW